METPVNKASIGSSNIMDFLRTAQNKTLNSATIEEDNMFEDIIPTLSVTNTPPIKRHSINQKRDHKRGLFHPQKPKKKCDTPVMRKTRKPFQAYVKSRGLR
jgi:hypothetical protein